MAYFPFFVNLEGKHVLVVGGGAVAARRVRVLLEFGCKVFVAAPSLGAEMKKLMDECAPDALSWECGEYHSKMLCVPDNSGQASRYAFVLAAALPKINRQVAEDCHKAGILVNDASRKEHCDFYFPGLVKEEELVIGITASGSDHRRVAALTAQIREMLQEQSGE